MDLTNSPIFRNVTAKQLPVLEVCEPETHEDVVDIVRSACLDKIPLYPVSTGHNWGYGSMSPAVSGCRLLNMGKMRRIRNVDGLNPISAINPVALIEPGVTQGGLYDYLTAEGIPLTFNVTGSARETSIIGNSLDRGVGYFGPRREDLFGLEVVLGNGNTIQTGFRRLGEASPLAHSHPYGLGPMLDGLFFQGNFGVVTSACFRLSPRRPKEVAVSLALRDDARLGEFIDELVRLKREGLMGSVTHVGNKARSQASLLYGITNYLQQDCGLDSKAAAEEAQKAVQIVAPDEWTSLAAVTGNTMQVKGAIREIRRRTQHLARTIVVSSRLLDIGFKFCHALNSVPRFRANAAAISAIRPLHGLALGVPTDAAIDNLMWKFGRGGDRATQLDSSSCGLLYVSPALPSDGAKVSKIMDELTAVARDFNHQLYTTINVETPTSLVAVINLLFDRDVEGEAQRAHACANALLQTIRSAGMEIYRARVDMMESVTSLNPEYWSTVRALKQTLDPHNIISPGRYNLST